MKIVHLIMTGGYSENWSYQDSVLIKEHAKDNEVYVISTQYERIQDTMVKVDQTDYISDIGVHVFRLPHRFDFLPTKVKTTLRIYDGIYELLEHIKPDIIFSHNVQYFGTNDIARYIKKYKNVRLYVDNHADNSNINHSWVSERILHRIIWRHCTKVLVPYTRKFWGVLPARVDFLVNVYGTPTNKTFYLPLGSENEKVARAEEKKTEGKVRSKYGIRPEDFLIVTGGKIDKYKKQTITLMKVVSKLPEKRVKLIIYGSVLDEIKGEFDALLDGERIFYAGWISSDDTYDYIAAADLVVYPGRHSVLWEQTVGQGRPMICKYWEGTTHVDIGGNVKFLYSDSEEELDNVIREVINPITYNQMKIIANGEKKNMFNYKDIAKKSIEM